MVRHNFAVLSTAPYKLMNHQNHEPFFWSFTTPLRLIGSASMPFSLLSAVAHHACNIHDDGRRIAKMLCEQLLANRSAGSSSGKLKDADGLPPISWSDPAGGAAGLDSGHICGGCHTAPQRHRPQDQAERPHQMGEAAQNLYSSMSSRRLLRHTSIYQQGIASTFVVPRKRKQKLTAGKVWPDLKQSNGMLTRLQGGSLD